jgi:creatinine amidohydrolase
MADDLVESGGPREVRLAHLRPAEVRAAMAEAPIAWLPWGAVEFHAEHLPFGTDGFSAEEVVVRAAHESGGIVLPWTALTIGTLHLPWTFRYDRGLVEGALRETIAQCAAHGARVVIVHTGHGPLDLAHLIKRVCAEAEASIESPEGFRAYGLCYLELNAALGAGLDADWRVAIDHGSIVETSWALAMAPELVRLERLPDDRDASGIVGVYGPNPRDRATSELGERQISACAALLAERARRLVAGERIDAFDDLREFVRRYWPEPLELAGRAGGAGDAALLLRNPAPVSRYLTALDLWLDGQRVGPEGVWLRNATPGEAGVAVTAGSLGPESGFYVRRGQEAEVLLPVPVDEGRRRVEVSLGLAGVAELRLEAEVRFA